MVLPLRYLRTVLMWLNDVSIILRDRVDAACGALRIENGVIVPRSLRHPPRAQATH